MDGTAGRYRQPGTDALFKATQDAARTLGYPTGDRNAKPAAPEWTDWRKQADGSLMKRPGGAMVTVTPVKRGQYRWGVFSGDRSSQGTATTAKAAQSAADAAHQKMAAAS